MAYYSFSDKLLIARFKSSVAVMLVLGLISFAAYYFSSHSQTPQVLGIAKYIN